VVKEFRQKAASQGGRIFHCGQCTVLLTIGSIAVSCSSLAVVPLLKTERSLSLRAVIDEWKIPFATYTAV